jgi:hypothetical protein
MGTDGIWSVSEGPNHKTQITNKFQMTKSPNFAEARRAGSLGPFLFLEMELPWNLVFGIWSFR